MAMGKNNNKAFWQRVSRLYDPVMGSWDKVYKAIKKGIVPVLRKEQNVLELCCGTGRIAFELSEYVNFWEATDFSEKMIAEAKKQSYISKLHFSVQDATSLPYADKSFDIVIIANALHIMPEPEKAMAEIRRVLKPGGLLFCPTFTTGARRSVKLKLFLAGIIGFRTYNKWSANEFVAFVKKCDFNVVEAHKIITHNAPPVCFVTAQYN